MTPPAAHPEAVQLLAELYGIQLAVFDGTGIPQSGWSFPQVWHRVRALLEREDALKTALTHGAELLAEERKKEKANGG